MENIKEKIYSKLYFGATLLLLLSSVLGIDFNGFNSIGVILLSIIWLIEGDFKNKFSRLGNEPFVFITTIFFLLYIISILFSLNKPAAEHVAQNNLSLFILPVIFFSKKIYKKEASIFLFKTFICGVVLWMSIATIIALRKVYITHDTSFLFYHNLALPLKSNAICAQMFCMISLALIFYIPASKNWKIGMFLIFSIWIMMLASRMSLFIYFVITIINLYTKLSKSYRPIATVAILLLMAGLSFTNNPIKQRFQDFEKFRFSYLTQHQFNEKIYFDGLSLRLVYWRFSLEILKEKQAYIFGVGTGDARDLLDNKIRSYHMNVGNDRLRNQGYLWYSFDDVYLETLVSFGFLGIFILLIYYGYIGYYGIKNKNSLLRDIFIILIANSFSNLITIDSQCDLTLILTVVYIAMQYSRIEKHEENICEILKTN